MTNDRRHRTALLGIGALALFAVGLVLRQALFSASRDGPGLASAGEPRSLAGSPQEHIGALAEAGESRDPIRREAVEQTRAPCDPIALFDAAYELLPSSGRSKDPVAEARRAPTDWLPPSLSCAEGNVAHELEAPLDLDSDALLAHVARRLVEDRQLFRRALLASALAEHCRDHIEVWDLLLTRHLQELCRLEQPFLRYSLEALPSFRDKSSEQRLPSMLEGAITVVANAEACCGEIETLYGWIAEKFPSELVLDKALEILREDGWPDDEYAELQDDEEFDEGPEYEDVDVDDTSVDEAGLRDGAIQMLRGLVARSLVQPDAVLEVLIRIGSSRLARSPSTSRGFYLLLDEAIEQGSQVAREIALQLLVDPGLEAREVGLRLGEHVSVLDVQAWLAKKETRDQALRLVLTLPLEKRPSSSELHALMRSSEGETYLLAMRAYLGPLEHTTRELEIVAEYLAATSLDVRLGILEVANYYRRGNIYGGSQTIHYKSDGTVDSSDPLLDRVAGDPTAAPELRARVRELNERFLASIPRAAKR